MRRVWTCLAATLLVASCKCGGPPGPLGDVLTSYCKFIDRCPGQLAYPIAYRSQAECVDILNFVFTCPLKVVDDPITGEPNVTFERQVPNLDPALAKECQAFLDSAACDVKLTGCDPDQPETCNPCSRAFAVAIADAGGGSTGATVDQPCSSSSECATGLYCLASRPTDGGETCSVCKPLRGPGGDCIDPPRVACGPGLFCQPNGTSGVCVALFAAGTACTSGGQCASTFCNPTTGVCDAGGKTGDPCTQNSDCRIGFCDPAASKCSAFRANGDPCTASDQCTNRSCDTGTQKCGKPDGATCTSSGECQNVCDTTARLCTPGTPLGGSCTSGAACASGYCHSELRVCARTCSAGCAANQFCDSYGACLDPRPDGASCRDADECTSGFCNDNDVCAKKPGLGDACRSSSDCLPLGRCSGGVCVAPAKPGQACSGLDSCAQPFFCRDGTCQLMDLSCQPARIGQPCAALTVCEPSGYCDPLKNFTCAAKKNQGESCVRGVECVSGLFCDRSVMQCKPPVGEGGSCARDQVCATGLFCDSSTDTCTGPRPAGASCSEGTDCQSRNCQSVSGSGTICVAACIPVPPGEQPVCHPARCADFGFTCGSIDGGCGETVYCGQCPGPYQTCGGGGQAGVCGCTPKRSCTSRECNTQGDDGCGTQLQCRGSCPDGGVTCGGGGTTGICGCPNDTTAGPGFGSIAVSALPPGSSTNYDPWDSVDSVFATDDAGAHVRFSSSVSSTSEVLQVTGFGFNLPPTASVNGITVEVRGRASSYVTIASVMVLAAGKLVPTSAGGGSLSTQWSSHRAGSSNDLWYWPFSVADVNSPDFGVQLQLRSFNRVDAWIDSVKVSVSYAWRCDCRYACRSDSECGSDGCGGVCGRGDGGCGADGGVCTQGYCQPPIFIDSSTGLMWSNESLDVGNCASLTLGGLTGWRAPTINELRTRVAGCPSTAPGGQCPASTTCTTPSVCLDAGCAGCDSRTGPGLWGCYLDKHLNWISCTGAGPLWSSTDAGTGPYGVDFGTGQILVVGGQPRYRCVRP